MMSKEQAVKALSRITDAIIETVKETEEHGAPGGVLYAALMTIGMTLEQFETVMTLLVETGKLRKSGDLYFAVRP